MLVAHRRHSYHSSSVLAPGPLPAELEHETAEALRQELAVALRKERQARGAELAELRAQLQGLEERQLGGEALRLPGAEVPAAEVEPAGAVPPEVERELQAERQSRCARLAELHARVTREVAELTCTLEQQCAAVAEELAGGRRRLEEQLRALERALGQEREQRGRESQELRAILEAVWQRAAAAPREHGGAGLQRLFAYPEGGTKEFVGDTDDVFTLYDMVREVLSDSSQLQKEIAEEREERRLEADAAARQTERLEFRVNALQAIVRSAASWGQAHARRGRTLAKLAEHDPKWGRLLHDPGQLFSGDDIIDKAYKGYLSDMLAVMTEHNCTFKRAVELSSAELSNLEAIAAEEALEGQRAEDASVAGPEEVPAEAAERPSEAECTAEPPRATEVAGPGAVGTAGALGSQPALLAEAPLASATGQVSTASSSGGAPAPEPP